MNTQAGLNLASQLPSLKAFSVYSQDSEADLRALGALSPHLPADFEPRLAAALAETRGGQEELAALSKTLEGAYQAAIPEVAKAVQGRSKQIAVAIAYGQMEGQELRTAAGELDRFDAYGPVVQDKTRFIKNLAGQRTMANAQRMAGDFLRYSRTADDVSRAAADAVEAGGSPSDIRRRMPPAWVLHAYEQPPKSKPADTKESAKPKESPKPKEPPKPEPEKKHEFREGLNAKRIDPVEFAKPKGPPAANPFSTDLYERIGANRNMSADEIKTAFRKASLSFHPDKHATEGPAVVARMTTAFQNIQEAYALLSDPKKRAKYDLQSTIRASSRRR